MKSFFYTVSALALAATGLASSHEQGMHKVVKRATDGPNDVQILNYALTLEYLEYRVSSIENLMISSGRLHTSSVQSTKRPLVD